MGVGCGLVGPADRLARRCLALQVVGWLTPQA
jgi:hypothetical protein